MTTISVPLLLILFAIYAVVTERRIRIRNEGLNSRDERIYELGEFLRDNPDVKIELDGTFNGTEATVRRAFGNEDVLCHVDRPWAADAIDDVINEYYRDAWGNS